MNALHRFFHGPYAAVRPYLLSKALLMMLALDVWRLMIGHAGRYGIDGFNVAHFAWLDALQPQPSAASYIAVLMLSGLLALLLALTGVRRGPALILFALYTFSWSMSMLDSYQHHYFVSLVLLCLAFFPRTSARELHPPDSPAPASQPPPPQPPVREHAWGYPLLGASIAIVYAYTALAKVDANWMQGHTMLRISSAEEVFAPIADLGEWLGLRRQQVWSWISTLVIPQEAALGASYLLAVIHDRAPQRWVRVLTTLGFVLALILHVGAEAMGLQIGWFSYYMLALAACYLLPLPLLNAFSRLVTWPARRLDAWFERWPPTTRITCIAAATVSCAILATAARAIDLPGAWASCICAGIALLAACAVWLVRRRGFDPRRYALATSVAALGMWLAIAAGPARWDFYRYLGGDLKRRGELDAALEAYERGEAHAPAGATRAKQIAEIRRALDKSGAQLSSPTPTP